MTMNGWLQILLFCGVVIAIVKPLGGYMTRVFNGERTFFSPIIAPIERGLYRLAGTSEKEEQHWIAYAVAMLIFNLLGILALYALQRLQQFFPYNPQALGAVPPELAFNTAVSFVSNTNWKNYGGEGTMSYLTQTAGLTVQNFLTSYLDSTTSRKTRNKERKAGQLETSAQGSRGRTEPSFGAGGNRTDAGRRPGFTREDDWIEAATRRIVH